MKLRHITLTVFLFLFGMVKAQVAHVSDNQKDIRTFKTSNGLGLFYLGVASGDPSANSVVLWTKLLGDSVNSINGIFEVALDTGFTQVVHSGSFNTGPQTNYTVKVNVPNLSPDTYYYYYFSALNENSLTGRTKTAPTSGPSKGRLKFGVLSCQNYEDGYFNILGEFATYNELDAILHLGDYIYEYPKDTVNVGRDHPTGEAISLAQYRERYDLYKSDTDLIRIHQQYPFIQVWDDHEVADNAWKDGAGNHNPNTEGPWSVRKSAGYRAFYEYQPMWPAQDSSVYRNISYGPMAEFLLLDTRFVGREEQIYDVTDTLVYEDDRTILGTQQFNWFTGGLKNSPAQWKLVANQVFFSPFHIGWAAIPPITANELENAGLDSWDGYPMERKRILDTIAVNQVDNVVILTGDIHAAFANEVADPVNDTGNGYAPVANYDPITGAGAGAVEFVTPSISSDNFDERFGALASGFIEDRFNKPLPNGNIPNPHTKFLDMDRHGGFILTLDSNQAQADYYFVPTRSMPLDSMYFETGLSVSSGTHKLNSTSSAYPKLANQPIPAPRKPRMQLIGLPEESVALFKVYPNPTSGRITIQSSIVNSQLCKVSVYNLAGMTLFEAEIEQMQEFMEFDLSHLPAGVYFMNFQQQSKTHVAQIEIVK